MSLTPLNQPVKKNLPFEVVFIRLQRKVDELERKVIDQAKKINSQAKDIELLKSVSNKLWRAGKSARAQIGNVEQPSPHKKVLKPNGSDTAKG